MNKFKRVAVLQGGTSSERKVSFLSGANVIEALKSLGYDVVPVTLDADNVDNVPDDVDAAFLALHGGYGENGGVQAALDARGIPYTGPGAAASRITIDKIATKEVLKKAGVATAPWAILDHETAECPIPLPVVVKPPKDGSSVGISRVFKPEEWKDALALARKTDKDGVALVEAFVPGREWTVGILAGKALPVIEIQAPNGWDGHQEKYLANATKYVFPEDGADAALKKLLKKAQKTALAAYKATGCRGVTRVDFRVSPEGETYVLELNTVPGFTAHSLVPKAAARTGLDFAHLCEAILDTAACDRTEK